MTQYEWYWENPYSSRRAPEDLPNIGHLLQLIIRIKVTLN